MKAKRWLIAILAIALVATMVCAVACDNHVHNYSEWGKNETQHWKYCPDDNEEEAGSRANHVYGDDGKCECGAEDPTDYTPFVSDKFYGAIGDMTMDGEDVTMSALIFTEEGEVFVNVMSEDGYCQGEYDYTVSDGVITVTMDDDSTVTGTIVANVISITLPLELTGADEQTVSKDIDFVGEMYLATINMYGDTMEMYVAKDTPLALLIELMDIDEEMTIKVDGQVVPANQYLSTKMPGKAITVDIIEPHYCDDVCDVCHKCLTDCTDPACEDKCLGHTHMVSYDLGEHAAAGSQAPEAKKYDYPGTLTVEAEPTPAEGWVFKGWSDGEGTYYYGDSYTMPDHAVTFTAIYARIINADSIKGVWQSDAGVKAYVADPIDDGDVAVIVNGTYFTLFYTGDNTGLGYSGHSIKYAENDKLDIDGVTYTYVGALNNSTNADFVGRWVEKDGTIKLVVTADSIDFSGFWYHAPQHVFIGEYLVLFNGNTDVYMLAKSDDTLEGYHYVNNSSTEVTFVVDTTVRITIADIVGTYSYENHTAYISTNHYASGVGGLVLDGAYHELEAGDNNTWTYKYGQSYNITVTYVDEDTIHITTASLTNNGSGIEPIDLDFTKTSVSTGDVGLSNFNGEWAITWGSNKYTMKVDSATDTFQFITWQTSNVYCIIGEYIVVSNGNQYIAIKVNEQDGYVLNGYATTQNGPETVTGEYSACRWPNYVGEYVINKEEGYDGIEDDDFYGVIIGEDSIVLVINNIKYKGTDLAYNADEKTFTFVANGMAWTMVMGNGNHNLWQDDGDVDIYLEEGEIVYDCQWIDYLGVYDFIYDDDSEEDWVYHEWVVTITEDGITLTFDGQSYDVTIVSFDDEFILSIDDLIVGEWTLCFDDDDIINLYCHDTEGDYPVDVYLWRQLDEEVDWEDLIGTYEGSGTDSERGEHIYKVVITRRGVHLYIDGEWVDVEEDLDASSTSIVFESDAGWFEISIQGDDTVKLVRYRNSDLDPDYIRLETTLTAVD